MRNRRLQLATAIAATFGLGTGCGGSGVVELHVEGALSGIDFLQLSAVNQGETSELYRAGPSMSPFSLPQVIALVFDRARRGSVTIDVAAIDVTGRTLAASSGSGIVTPGAVTRVTVLLGGARDGGLNLPPPDLTPVPDGADLAVVDLASTDHAQVDLAGLPAPDLAFVVGPSCVGLAATCSASGSANCCSSNLVQGGTFFRSYDGVTAGYTSTSYPATVSNFRLDNYEVTVGRFRKWVAAGLPRPAPGGGGRTLNGLANQGGWNTSWNANVASQTADLKCNMSYQTWTDAVSANENKAITCVNWYDAFAFCVWDGGFLPTEAEWKYAAAGGNQQRVYPWSAAFPPGCTSSCIDATYAVYAGSTGVAPVGSKSPKGDGRFGQSDLSGNVWEWTLDQFGGGAYPLPCSDCLAAIPGMGMLLRGGGWSTLAANMVLASNRSLSPPTYRTSNNFGIRCARRP